MTHTDELPNDVEALKRIIAELQERSAVEIERLKAEHQAAIAALFRRYYGPRSESFDRGNCCCSASASKRSA